MSASSFFQSARDVRAFLPLGLIGEVARSHDFKSITAVNSAPQAAQVTTISVPSSPDNSTAYKVTIDGVVCSYTTDGSATQAELGNGLVDAINTEPGARAKMSAAYSGGTLTLTGVWPGVAVTVSVNSSETTQDLGSPTNSTSAASADTVSPGLVIASDGHVTDEGNPKGFVPSTSSFTAQVISFTFATASGSYFGGTVRMNGKTVSWRAAHNTDLDTTCAGIATAINTAVDTLGLAGATVLAASVGSAGGVVTLTAEVPGAEFDADAWASGSASGTASKAYTTGPSRSTSLRRALLGVSVRRLDLENATVGGDNPVYAANDGVEVAQRGTVVVQRSTSETWSLNDEVFVSLASATKGRIYNSTGANRVWLPREILVIERGERSTSSDGVGVIRINTGA